MDALIWLEGKMSLSPFSTSSTNSHDGPVKNPRSQPILFKAHVNLERALWFLVKILAGATTLSDLCPASTFFWRWARRPSRCPLVGPGGFSTAQHPRSSKSFWYFWMQSVKERTKLSSVCLPSEVWLSAQEISASYPWSLRGFTPKSSACKQRSKGVAQFQFKYLPSSIWWVCFQFISIWK